MRGAGRRRTAAGTVLGLVLLAAGCRDFMKDAQYDAGNAIGTYRLRTVNDSIPPANVVSDSGVIRVSSGSFCCNGAGTCRLGLSGTRDGVPRTFTDVVAYIVVHNADSVSFFLPGGRGPVLSGSMNAGIFRITGPAAWGVRLRYERASLTGCPLGSV